MVVFLDTGSAKLAGWRGPFVSIPESFRKTSGFLWSLYQKADEEWGCGRLLVKLGSLWSQGV